MEGVLLVIYGLRDWNFIESSQEALEVQIYEKFVSGLIKFGQF